MKKWTLLLLTPFILIVGPSVIQAQEMAKPSISLTSVVKGLSSVAENLLGGSQTNIPTSQTNSQSSQVQSGQEGVSSEQPTSPVQAETVNNMPEPIHNETALNQPKPAEVSPAKSSPPPTDADITQQDRSETGIQRSASMDAKSSLGITHLGVIETSKEVSGESINTKSSLLNADVEAPIIGQIQLLVGDLNTIQAPNYQAINWGLLRTDLNSPLLGNTHLGLSEIQKVKTDRGTFISGGLVILDLKNSPLGDTHIGVGEFGIKEIQPVTIPPINKGSPPNDVSPGKPPDSSGRLHEENQQGANGPPLNPLFAQRNIQETDGSEQDAWVKDAADKAGLNHPSYNDSFSSDSANSETIFPLTDAWSASAGNGSASGGNASSSGGSGIDTFFDSASFSELNLNSYVQFILKELSDEWIKTPPIKPPQDSFFLSLK